MAVSDKQERSNFVDLEHGEEEVHAHSTKSEWLKMALPGTFLLATGLVATYVSNQFFGNVASEPVAPNEDSRRLEEAAAMDFLGVFIWCGCAILCTAIQYAAYMRSRGSPHDLKDGLSWDSTDPDVYGDKLELKQLFKAKECFGCEAKNRYQSKDEKFFIDEQSDCLQRLIASTNRELTLFGHQGSNGEAAVNLRMYKPYHLQGCCFCRPSLQIDKANGAKVGTIEDPFKCCTMDQQIMDASGAQKFTVYGSICQCGMCCPCCADVNFDINDKGGSSVGKITRPALTCGEMCMKTNRFEVEFPKQCSMDDKHLLVGSAMLLDLQYFEKNKNDN